MSKEVKRKIKFCGLWLPIITLLFVLLSPFVLLSCGGRQPAVIVGGKIIDRRTFQETTQRYYGRSMMRWLIQKELLFITNEQRKLVSDKEVEREFKKSFQRAGFKDEHQFLSYLARQGLEKQDFIQDIKFNLILQRLREEFVKPADKQLKEFYERNKTAFIQPPIVRTYLIQSEDEKALKKAKELAKKGEDIRQLAYEFNKDPQLKSSRGYVEVPLVADPHTTPPAMVRLLRLLIKVPLNQITGPHAIPEGRFFVLVKVVERIPAFVPPFEDIKPKVREVFVQRFGPSPEEVFRKLAKKIPVSIQDPRFKFLEDEIITQTVLESPPSFQSPVETPELTRSPSREGGKLEENVR